MIHPSTSSESSSHDRYPDRPRRQLDTDRVGAVEATGIEYLPEDARDSRPRNLGAVFLGANFTWTNVVFGAFAILFGLTFWQTVASMAVGTALGTLAVLPTAIIGPRTGTNMTVSSGAFFGIRGRFIGSGIALAIAVAIRCDDCIAFHVKAALEQGASREEVTEALGMAIYMGAGPAVMYASHALEAFGQFAAPDEPSLVPAVQHASP